MCKIYVYEVVREWSNGRRAKQVKKFESCVDLYEVGYLVALGNGFPGISRILSKSVKES